MFQKSDDNGVPTVETLSARGYWPAVAARYLSASKYSKAVEICKENLPHEPALVSARLVYARALYHAGQIESSAEQFYYILSLDPDNIVALKYLGDIKFADHDEPGALADYEKVLEIDPQCRALCSPLNRKQPETTRTITIARPAESSDKTEQKPPLREIHFYTETMADLYLSQGHPRLAAEVYRVLHESRHSSRLAEKLQRAEEKVKEREYPDVKKTD